MNMNLSNNDNNNNEKIAAHERTCRKVSAKFPHVRETFSPFLTFTTCKTVTNDENAVNVSLIRGNFIDPTCHEYQVRAAIALVCAGLNRDLKIYDAAA